MLKFSSCKKQNPQSLAVPYGCSHSSSEWGKPSGNQSEAEGRPETRLPRINPKLFVCFPWERKWKSPNRWHSRPRWRHIRGVHRCSGISRVFVIVAADFFFLMPWKLPFLLKNVKTPSVFHISLVKKSSILQQFQLFSYFWMLDFDHSLKTYSMIEIYLWVSTSRGQFITSLPLVYHQFNTA